MAEVIGRCSSLPGACHPVPAGTACDEHPERIAKYRVQGETDSFGAELHDMCEECYQQHRAAEIFYREKQKHGICEWCSSASDDLRQTRDYEEGSCGPIYMVCRACIKRRDEEARQELEDLDDLGDYDDYDPVESCEDNWDSVPEPSLQEEQVEEFVGPEVEDDRPAGYPVAYVDGQFIFR